MDLPLQLVAVHQLNLALIDLISAALRLEQPELPDFLFGKLIQALRQS